MAKTTGSKRRATSKPPETAKPTTGGAKGGDQERALTKGTLERMPTQLQDFVTDTVKKCSDSLRAAYSEPKSFWRKFGAQFVSRSGGLTLWAVLPLAFIAYFLGNGAYVNLQQHYQKAFLASTANVDVIAQVCNSRSDILWQGCADSETRGQPSDRFIWSMLVSAGIIDPLNTPTPSQLEDLNSKDKAADIVARWIRDGWENSKPYENQGVGLLIAATGVCSGGATANKDPATSALVTAYLSDIYAPLNDTTGWLSPELKKAGLSWLPWLGVAGAEKAEEVQPWLAPVDLRAYILSDSEGVGLREDRAAAWLELNSSGSETPKLDHFISASENRRSIASHVGDDDLVAVLFTYGGLIETRSGQFISDFSSCSLLEEELKAASGGGVDIDLTLSQTTLANFEKLALFIAGQIRVSPEAKQARFWVSIYTGHEQRLIMILGTFGVLVAMVKIAVFGYLNFKARSPGNRPSLSPFENPEVDPDERDNEFDGLASSRWVMKLPIALLPAIGFIGTVRGIMLSLSGADAIVWAETVNERSSAISGLSADLGLAFATTLLALLGGALLTFLSLSEMALGERLLLRRYSKPRDGDL